jgi:small subunit ribosomal protein S7
MARRKRAQKRKIIPDPVYKDTLVTKFVNKLMIDGKKSLSEKIFYESLEVVSKKLNEEPIKIFKKALDNVRPLLEVKSRRVGGATYQVPIEVPINRGYALSMRWIVGNARNRKEKSMVEKLANELIDAFNEKGASVKKREDTHKMAEANKAFAHYMW